LNGVLYLYRMLAGCIHEHSAFNLQIVHCSTRENL
jgi:hypothetical protein